MKHDVTIVFKNSSAVLNFEADEVEVWSASQENVDAGEAERVGELVGYSIRIEKGAMIFLDLKEIAGFIALAKDGDAVE